MFKLQKNVQHLQSRCLFYVIKGNKSYVTSNIAILSGFLKLLCNSKEERVPLSIIFYFFFALQVKQRIFAPKLALNYQFFFKEQLGIVFCSNVYSCSLFNFHIICMSLDPSISKQYFYQVNNETFFYVSNEDYLIS